MGCEDTVMTFGKHQGKTLRDILLDDPTYLDWLQDAEIRSAPLKAAVKEMGKKYEAQIEDAVEGRGEFDGQ